MPGEREELDRSYELTRDMTRRLAELRPDGVPPSELGSLIIQNLMQLRALYTFDELHDLMHAFLRTAEKYISKAKWVNVDGTPSEAPILAEMWKGDPVATAMRRAMEHIPDDLAGIDEEGE